MKSIFIEKYLGLDIREDSVALTVIGKKFRDTEIIAGEFIDLKLLTILSVKTKCVRIFLYYTMP